MSVGHHPWTINLPLSDFGTASDAVPPRQGTVVVYCSTGIEPHGRDALQLEPALSAPHVKGFPPGFVGWGSRRTSCDPISETIGHERISPSSLISQLAGRLLSWGLPCRCGSGQVAAPLNRSHRVRCEFQHLLGAEVEVKKHLGAGKRRRGGQASTGRGIKHRDRTGPIRRGTTEPSLARFSSLRLAVHS